MRSKTNVWKYVMKLIMNKRANHKTRMVHVCQLSRLNWTICSLWHETANKCIWFADVHHQDFYWIKFINKSRYDNDDDVQQHLMLSSALEHELSSNTKATIYQLIFTNQPSVWWISLLLCFTPSLFWLSSFVHFIRFLLNYSALLDYHYRPTDWNFAVAIGIEPKQFIT